MKRQKSNDSADRKYFGAADRLLAASDDILGGTRDPRVMFSEFSRLLETEFEIRKGFLALREGDQTRFLAVASWKQDGTRKNLSLRLPKGPSLFEKVAESGQGCCSTTTPYPSCCGRSNTRAGWWLCSVTAPMFPTLLRPFRKG